ncbi:MAG: hypothetical protein V4520_08285 [Bacteroidota bacterium]
MSNSKVEIKIGVIEFSGEGEQDWVAIQLDKIIAKVPELLKLKIDGPVDDDEAVADGKLDVDDKRPASSKISNLASWLREKGATTSQVKKFLATAAFLQIEGKHRVSTADVIAALKNSNQSKLGNASDNLNANVKKGLCEKDGNEFFVTTEGMESLAIK